MGELSLSDLANMIRDLQRRLDCQARDEAEFRRVLILLAHQAGDITHASVETAAKIKGCSTKTIRRQIAAGVYTLEKRKGERAAGIPIEQLYSGWVPIAVARRAHEREQKESAEREGQGS